MNVRNWGCNWGKRCRGVVGAVLLGCLSVPAQADTITPLFESTTLVTGASINLAILELDSPGTVLIELTDLNWPALLGSLSFSITDAAQVFQTFTLGGATNGSWSFDVSAPTTLYAAVFAKPSSSAKAGMYHVDVSYQSVTPVPLPAAAWFLISGIAGFAAFRPKQKLSQTCA